MLKLKITELKSAQNFEDWSRIELFNNGDSIFDEEWNYIPILSWFIENEYNIKNDCFFIQKNNKSSAENLHFARNIPFAENFIEETLCDLWYEEIFKFYYSHGISMAFRGKKVPDLIFSCKNNIGELSFYNGKRKDSFMINFDIENFFIEIHKYVDILNVEIEK